MTFSSLASTWNGAAEPEPPFSSSRFRRPREWGAIAALILTGTMYFWGLDAIPLQPGNEAMYAHPAAVMARGGDLLVPQYEHGPFLEKPPVTWWILAASYRVSGVSVFAERLPGAVAALGTVLLLALWVRPREGSTAAFATAIALICSFKFAGLARTSPADTFLAFAVTLAVISLDRAARDSEPSDWQVGVCSGAVLSLAFGIKGLVGLALPVGGVVLGLLLDRKRPVHGPKRATIAFGTLLVTVAPWHWAMSRRFGIDFWRLFYWDNHVLRATTAAFVDHPRGPAYYLGALLLSVFPWSLFVLPGLFSKASRGSSAAAGWFLFGLAFLSAMNVKREVYLMPLFPAVAVIVGRYLARNHRDAKGRRWVWAGSAAAPLAALVLWFRMRAVLPSIAGHDAYLAIGVSLTTLLLSLLGAARLPQSGRTLGWVGASCALFFFSVLLVETRLSAYDPFPVFGKAVAGKCAGDCTGYRVGLGYTSIDFYSGFEWDDTEGPNDIPTDHGGSPVYAVLRAKDAASLRSSGRSISVIDRRPWLNENWATAALHPERFGLVELDLVRLDEMGTRGTLPAPTFRALPRPARFPTKEPPHRLWRQRGPAAS